MGAVMSNASLVNNATMFDTNTTLQMGFSTIKTANTGRAMEKAENTQNLLTQAPAVAAINQGAYGPPGMYGGGYGMGGYGMGGYGYGMGGGFNALLFAIEYLVLGLFAIGFVLTYFVDMDENLASGLAGVFGFFFVHHLAYLTTMNMGNGYLTSSQGVMMFLFSMIVGGGFGALWGYFLLDKINGTQAGNIVIGVVGAITALLCLIMWSHRWASGTSIGYAARSAMLQAGSQRMGPGYAAAGYGMGGPMGGPMGGGVIPPGAS